MNKLFNHITLLEAGKGGYPCCNCLYIEDGVSCIIDTASPELNEFNDDSKRSVDLIVNSHGHIDHFLKNDQFPFAKTLLHKDDLEMVYSGDAYFESFHYEEYSGLPKEPVLQALQYRPCRVDEYLADGQKQVLGSTGFEIMHLPGHTPGHCGFLFPKEGFVFLADITLDPVGPAYLNTASSIDDFISSINRIINLQPDMVVTGHRTRPFTSHIERHLAHYRDKIYEREQRVVKVLESGAKSLREIAAEAPVYKKLLEPQVIWYAYECTSCRHHLERLINLGKVVRQDDKYALVDGVHSSNLQLG